MALDGPNIFKMCPRDGVVPSCKQGRTFIFMRQVARVAEVIVEHGVQDRTTTWQQCEELH
jgi:hypothetical protein